MSQAKTKETNKLSSVWSHLWHATTGPLTSELVLEPGKFGLGRVPEKLMPDSTTNAVCGFCSTGCSLNLHLRDGQAVNLTPSHEYPVNQGMACPKGWAALSVTQADDRGTTPLVRSRDSGKRRDVSWHDAMTLMCQKFKSIQKQYGDDSVAFISTGQIPTEEMAFLGALAKFAMRMKHGDGNTRQCMATAVVAYKQAFGFDAPPYTYQDFEESDVLVLVGSNLCVAHPIMWQRVLNNPHNPEIVVLDPRRTETAMSATEHLPLKPKSDLNLLYGIARLLIERDWVDTEFLAAHTNGFEEFKEYLLQDPQYELKAVAEHAGLAAEQIERVVEIIHAGKRVSFWWTMGVNQSYEGVRTAQAIINIALMTGNIGRPGTGANSITGQCNAMGSRLFSNTTNLLGGHDFGSAEDRQKVADILGIDESLIPREASAPYHEIMEGILRGKIRGLWVICTNTAHSWINQNDCHDILSRLDYLVVQDMYHSTETAEMADLYLPAAGWAEKDGTFINSERRFGVLKKVSRAPGQALSDFSIFRLLAEYWGCSEMFSEWDSPAAVFEIMKRLSAGQPCDITGIEDYQMLDDRGGLQWPFTVDDAKREAPSDLLENQRRLFADGKFYHADQKARFLFEQSVPMPEPPNQRFPYLLLTGRGSAAQWHTNTRTGKSAVLRRLSSQEPFVEINPEDARRDGITPNQDVIVESQRGRLRAKAFVTPTVQPGQVFMPMHYDSTNRLTHPHFDPYSKQPSYKDCAVRIKIAESHDEV